MPSLDRLSRDVCIAENLFHEFAQLGVEVLVADMPTYSGKDRKDVLIRQIRDAIGEENRKDILSDSGKVGRSEHDPAVEERQPRVRSSPKAAGKSSGDALRVAIKTRVLGNTEIAAPLKIVELFASTALGVHSMPAHFRSFGTTGDVARLTTGATR